MNLYNGGRKEKMPIVQIDMVEGRSAEQKRALAKKVTEAIVETAQCPAEAVTIVIRETTKQNIAKAGVLMSDK
ncbi:2-hydroxymuconate tautomerase [Lucifera butyrica]|nr:2-hydroxymuconate tautomerase [Lucifera butyrica]